MLLLMTSDFNRLAGKMSLSKSKIKLSGRVLCGGISRKEVTSMQPSKKSGARNSDFGHSKRVKILRVTNELRS